MRRFVLIDTEITAEWNDDIWDDFHLVWSIPEVPGLFQALKAALKEEPSPITLVAGVLDTLRHPEVWRVLEAKTSHSAASIILGIGRQEVLAAINWLEVDSDQL